jgi:uncharacterized membrane protein YhiD involved in acid resistance
MLIGFFIAIILLITLVIFAINPITRAVNNSIARHNEAVEKRRIKKEETERKEKELEAVIKETEELREKLKLEAEINDKLRKESAERVYLSSLNTYEPFEPTRKSDHDYYDWGLDEPVGAPRRRRSGDWEIW